MKSDKLTSEEIKRLIRKIDWDAVIKEMRKEKIRND